MKTEHNFILNNENVSTELNPAETVLDYLRLNKKLTGTKEGCREGDCGACTILVGSIEKNKLNYKSVNSCLLPLAGINGKHVVTIEGLNSDELNPIQQNMVDEGGTQCGFCTPGFIVSAANYFLNNTTYDVQQAIGYLDGNICRCTGYEGIKRAIDNVISIIEKNEKNGISNIGFLIQAGILPQYFASIEKRLKKLNKETKSNHNSAKKKKTDFIVSGGTDLYVQKWETLYDSDINFISIDNDLNQISKVGNKIHIGSAVTVEEFGSSKLVLKYFPQLNSFIKSFGSLPIRNRATIAGNLVNASPIADISNILLALNAQVIISNGKKHRNIPLKSFYLDYKKTDLKTSESIRAVEIEIPPKVFYFNYEKVSRRTYLDIASVNTSFYLETKNDVISKIHLSAGGVAPYPLYLNKTCLFLTGKKITLENIFAANKIVKNEISPISDARGSKEYKALLLRQLIIAHFVKLFPELVEDGIVL